MTSPWSRLSEADLRQLGGALQTGRLTLPFSAVGLARYLAVELIESVVAESQRLQQLGMTAPQVAHLLATLANDRAAWPGLTEALDLVVTGPEAPGVALRDTAVVVRELFAQARERVLVVGYAVHQGRSVFRVLAERMAQRPELEVRLCLHVPRPWNDASPAAALVQRFAERLKRREWPGSRWPAVYYDPRALAPDASQRASLHAKCVVVDRQVAFVSSANFTAAAQERNIEVGVLLRVPAVAEQLDRHFQALIEAGVLTVLPEGD